MAHELTDADVLLLNREKAWHGLGLVVDEDLGAVEGAERVGLLWEVEQYVPEVKLSSGESLPLMDYRVNVRADTTPKHCLGIVSDAWQIVQNRQLAEFCDELASEGDNLKIESCGSIRNGAKVWFLIRGDSFAVRNHDVVKSYICVSNGFDGKTGIRVTPTDVRVVCSNTLHMVIPMYDGSRFRLATENGYSCSHVGDLKKRIQDVRAALGLYREAHEASATRAEELVKREVTRAELGQYFLELYSRHFQNVLCESATPKQVEKSKHEFLKFMQRFDREANAFGATKWIMANAYSGYVQHDRKSRLGFGLEETKISKNLFGAAIEMSDEAFAYALAV